MYEYFTVATCSTHCATIILRWLLESDAIIFIFIVLFLFVSFTVDNYWLLATQPAKIIFPRSMCCFLSVSFFLFNGGDSYVSQIFLVPMKVYILWIRSFVLDNTDSSLLKYKLSTKMKTEQRLRCIKRN